MYVRSLFVQNCAGNNITTTSCWFNSTLALHMLTIKHRRPTNIDPINSDFGSKEFYSEVVVKALVHGNSDFTDKCAITSLILQPSTIKLHDCNLMGSADCIIKYNGLFNYYKLHYGVYDYVQKYHNKHYLISLCIL